MLTTDVAIRTCCDPRVLQSARVDIRECLNPSACFGMDNKKHVLKSIYALVSIRMCRNQIIRFGIHPHVLGSTHVGIHPHVSKSIRFGNRVLGSTHVGVHPHVSKSIRNGYTNKQMLLSICMCRNPSVLGFICMFSNPSANVLYMSTYSKIQVGLHDDICGRGTCWTWPAD